MPSSSLAELEGSLDSPRSTERPGRDKATVTSPNLWLSLGHSGCSMEIGGARKEVGWPGRRLSQDPRWKMEVRTLESISLRTKARRPNLMTFPDSRGETMGDGRGGNRRGQGVGGVRGGRQGRELWVEAKKQKGDIG